MQSVPASIKLNAPGGIQIRWTDGHEAVYPYGYLRRRCPCATCREKPPEVKDEDNPFPIFGEKPIRVVGATPVGRYGVQFQWNDHHSAGIYTFSYLRQICPCTACSSRT